MKWINGATKRQCERTPAQADAILNQHFGDAGLPRKPVLAAPAASAVDRVDYNSNEV
jgi:hypothetical protein